MMDELEIIVTADGSHTLRNKKLDETYHSIHGAVRESRHVFIKHGLRFYHETSQPKKISILEIGFGTALNALLTLQYSEEFNVSVHYTTLEPFPLERDVWSVLNYGEGDRKHFEDLHEAPWNVEHKVSASFTILKADTPLQESALPQRCDVIYFDAFAPSVQPELWKPEMLDKVVQGLTTGGVLVTYSAKGQLKRDLRAIGLTVETLPGPPGKLEMVRAIK